MGVGLVKQYSQAGLAEKIPVLSAFTVDEYRRCRRSRTPRRHGSGARTGRPISTIRQNKKFVARYEATYNIVPGTYAFQAYDAAMLIDRRGQGVKGDLANKEAVTAAFRRPVHVAARCFKFNTNGYPIQDFT